MRCVSLLKVTAEFDDVAFAAEDALFLPAAHKGMSTTRMNISNCNLSSERMVAYNIVKQPHAAAATGGAAFGFKLVKALHRSS